MAEVFDHQYIESSQLFEQLDRARIATAKGLRQKMVRFGTRLFEVQKTVDKTHEKSLYCKELKQKRP